MWKNNAFTCDQCGSGLTLFKSGTIVLAEQASPPNKYTVYHFHNLEELRDWLEDKEQIIGR